jgi:flagellar hook protein FlgE
MLSTIYAALSGMLGFSKGLDVISNNIANLNTPGFKASELEFRDLFYRYSQDGGAPDGSRSQVGSGLDTKGTRTRFRQGELRDSGNPLDVAIDGNGFLVLQPKDGSGVVYGRGVSQIYTRAGQLEFGTDGILAERVTGARVMVYDGASMHELSIDSLRTSAPSPTANIRLSGNFLPSNDNSSTNPTAEVRNVTVFDQDGRSRTLSILFTRDSSDSAHWFGEVRDESNTLLLPTGGEVRFQPNGAPAAGGESFSVTLTAASGSSSSVRVEIGEAGSFSGVTNLSGPTQNLQVRSQDGVAAGSLTSATFDERGTLRLAYSNGKTTSGPSLALAWFDDLQALRLTSGSLFVNDGGQAPVIGTAREGIMGGVAAGRVELSNVELTEQFTDLIILQRGYQASSQVTSVANEMIQQLLDLDRKR